MTETNAKDALLPCPMCEHAAELLETNPVLPNGMEDTLFHVECTNRRCGLRTMDWYPANGATAAWNRRAALASSQPSEREKKLVGALRECRTPHFNMISWLESLLADGMTQNMRGEIERQIKRFKALDEIQASRIDALLTAYDQKGGKDGD